MSNQVDHEQRIADLERKLAALQRLVSQQATAQAALNARISKVNPTS